VGEPVLVVDRRPLDVDEHLAGGEVVVAEVADARDDLVVATLEVHGAKHGAPPGGGGQRRARTRSATSPNSGSMASMRSKSDRARGRSPARSRRSASA